MLEKMVKLSSSLGNVTEMAEKEIKKANQPYFAVLNLTCLCDLKSTFLKNTLVHADMSCCHVGMKYCK